MIIVAAPTKNAASPIPVTTRIAISHQSACDEAVHGGRRRDDERAADDEHASAHAVADAARERSQRDRAERERADGDTDRDLAQSELVLDVVRDDRREHREREEVREPARDDEHEAPRQQALRARRGRVH